MNPNQNTLPGFGFDPGFEPKPYVNPPAPPSGSIFGLISKVNQGIIQQPPKSILKKSPDGNSNAGLEQAKAVAEKLSVISPHAAREQQKQKAFLDAKSTIEKIQMGVWKPQASPQQQPSFESVPQQQIQPVDSEFKIPQLPVKAKPLGPSSEFGQGSGMAFPSRSGAPPINIQTSSTGVPANKSLVAYDDDDEKERNQRSRFHSEHALKEIDRYRNSRSDQQQKFEDANLRRDNRGFRDEYPANFKRENERDRTYGNEDQHRGNYDRRDDSYTDRNLEYGRPPRDTQLRTEDRYRDNRIPEESRKESDQRDDARTSRNDGFEKGAPTAVFDYGHLIPRSETVEVGRRIDRQEDDRYRNMAKRENIKEVDRLEARSKYVCYEGRNERGNERYGSQVDTDFSNYDDRVQKHVDQYAQRENFERKGGRPEGDLDKYQYREEWDDKRYDNRNDRDSHRFDFDDRKDRYNSREGRGDFRYEDSDKQERGYHETSSRRGDTRFGDRDQRIDRYGDGANRGGERYDRRSVEGERENRGYGIYDRRLAEGDNDSRRADRYDRMSEGDGENRGFDRFDRSEERERETRGFDRYDRSSEEGDRDKRMADRRSAEGDRDNRRFDRRLEEAVRDDRGHDRYGRRSEESDRDNRSGDRYTRRWEEDDRDGRSGKRYDRRPEEIERKEIDKYAENHTYETRDIRVYEERRNHDRYDGLERYEPKHRHYDDDDEFRREHRDDFYVRDKSAEHYRDRPGYGYDRERKRSPDHRLKDERQHRNDYGDTKAVERIELSEDGDVWREEKGREKLDRGWKTSQSSQGSIPYEDYLFGSDQKNQDNDDAGMEVNDGDTSEGKIEESRTVEGHEMSVEGECKNKLELKGN